MQKKKIKPIFEFVSPLPLEVCIKRLEKRHEPSKPMAVGGTRLHVTLWPINDLTYSFSVDKLQKNSEVGLYNFVWVKGYLREADEDHTLVVGELYTDWFALIFITLIASIIIHFFLLAVINLPLDGAQNLIRLIPIILITIVLAVIFRFFGILKANQVATTVKNTLGYNPVNDLIESNYGGK